jgi:CarD family transcriptional regulator
MNSVYEKETFFIPVTHEDSLRKPLTKAEALDLIDHLTDLEPISHLNDEEYRNVIHNYDCYSYAKIVKGIHAKSEYISSLGKRLSNVDGKYFHLAEKYLHDELAFALDIRPNEVEQYIKDRIESAEEHISA